MFSVSSLPVFQFLHIKSVACVCSYYFYVTYLILPVNSLCDKCMCVCGWGVSFTESVVRNHVHKDTCSDV